MQTASASTAAPASTRALNSRSAIVCLSCTSASATLPYQSVLSTAISPPTRTCNKASQTQRLLRSIKRAAHQLQGAVIVVSVSALVCVDEAEVERSRRRVIAQHRVQRLNRATQPRINLCMTTEVSAMERSKASALPRHSACLVCNAGCVPGCARHGHGLRVHVARHQRAVGRQRQRDGGRRVPLRG